MKENMSKEQRKRFLTGFKKLAIYARPLVVVGTAVSLAWVNTLYKMRPVRTYKILKAVS